MKRSSWWVLAVIFAVLALLVGCGLLSLLLIFMPSSGGYFGGGNTVAVIEIQGTIVSGDSSARGASSSERIIANLTEAIENPSVGAIVLEINSPGGSVTPSVDIYNAVRESPKPVVSSFGEVAASGAYYLASASQRIVARPATITGSIGVRWEIIELHELMQKLGVSIGSIQTGSHKDLGSPYRPLTEEEAAIYQALADEAYEDFVHAVADGRSLPEDCVYTLADGRIYSGRQALELGLVDQLGDLDDAIVLAAELGGVVGKPRILKYAPEPGLVEALLGVASHAYRPTEMLLLQELLEAGTPKLRAVYSAP